MRRLGEVVDISPAKYKFWTKKVFFIPMELIPQGEKAFTDFQIKDINELKSGTPVYPNDLLLAKITPCFENGKIGFVPPIDGCFIATTEIHPIRPKRKIDSGFLFFFLRHPKIKEYLKNNMTGTSGRKRVPKNALKNLLTLLPPIELQKQFAQIVEEFEKKREEMQRTLKILESLFKLLQKKAFTGELTAEWREQNNVEWEIPLITERQAVLLAGIYYHQNMVQKPAMLTVAMKSAFLLQQEAGLNLGYDFIPYKYGPFSREVYEDIEELEKNLLVERVKPKKDIEMTEIRLIEEFKDWTEKIIDSLPEDIKEIVKEYIEKYGKMELNELLDYVYAKYPEYAVKSKRKRKNRRHSKRTNKR